MARDDRRRKVLAVLAGGLVLGVGGAVTLAAWNDSEFVTGEFAAGSFDLEGSTTSATDGFTDHDSAAGAAALEFTLPLADNLAPEDTVFAPFWVRLDSTTTSPAALTASAITATGENAANLAYTVHAIAPTATCDATTATGAPLASGATLDALTAGDPVDLAVGAGDAPGTATQLCFAVTAGDELVEAEGATATWSFTAVSQ